MAVINKKKMRISAVIPLYNAEDYIEATLDSLLKQTQPIDEIIVVDDCGTDRSVNIVEFYSEEYENIRIIHQDENRGVSAARNRGIHDARNEWILFMDADDVAEPTLVEEIFLYFENHNQHFQQENLILIYPALRQIDEKGLKISEVLRGKEMLLNEAFGDLLVRNHIITPSGVLVNKKYLIKNNGFSISRKINEDWELWLKLSQFGMFGYIDKPLVNVRRHCANTTNQINKTIQAEIEIINSYDISIVRKAILARSVDKCLNIIDYVSVLFRLGKWDEGFNELVENMAMGCSENASFYFYLGVFHIEKGDYSKAQDCFEKVLKKDCNHGAAMNNLGAIHFIKNNTSVARNMFVNALKLYPNYVDVKQNLQIIEGVHSNENNVKFTYRELRKVLLKYTESSNNE